MSDELVKRLRGGLAIGEEAADRIEELEKRNASLEAAIKRQAGAARTLREYTLAEVRHLSDMDRSEYFAAQTVDSERDANAMLTDRIEELEAKLNKLLAVSERALMLSLKYSHFKLHAMEPMHRAIAAAKIKGEQP